MINAFIKISLISILVYTYSIVQAQDFSTIDSHAKIAPRSAEKQVENLVEYLNKNTTNNLEKVRSYYIWLTQNIEYDTKVFFSSNPNPKTGNENTLKYKRAVCQGYAELFKTFCDLSNIPCFIVSGYSKGYGYSSQKAITNTDHAWNAVCIDNKWYLIDATWGAGYVDDKQKYVQEFNNDYFLSEPEYFILKHLPADPMWQLLPCPITITNYKKEDKEIISKLKNCSGSFNFNDTITDYLKLTPIQQQMKSAERAFKFNPDNVEAPGYALLNVAYDMSNELNALYKNDEYNKALELNKSILEINKQAYNYLKKSKTQHGKSAANICKQNIASSKDNIKSLEGFLK